MLNNISKAVKTKQDQLAKKKPGAVVYSEPKIIWAKMIECVGGEFNGALTVRYRFNAALEDQLASRKHHYILDVGKAIAETNFFTIRNGLNDKGMNVFWRQVDKLIKEFEENHEQLKPVKQVQFDTKEKFKKTVKKWTSFPKNGY